MILSADIYQKGNLFLVHIVEINDDLDLLHFFYMVVPNPINPDKQNVYCYEPKTGTIKQCPFFN